MIRVQEVSDAQGLEGLKGAWNGLLERAPNATIFDTHEWQTSWLQAFRPGLPIRFLFFWEGDLLEGVAPLLPERSVDPWCGAPSLLSTIHPHSYRASVLCGRSPEAVLAALLEHLKASGSFPALAFPNARADAPVATLLPGVAARSALSSASLPGTPSPILRVSGEWDAYLRGHSKNLAKMMKKKLRHFEQAGRARLVVVSRPQECAEGVADAVQVEARSWKQNIEGSLSANPKLARLHEAFALAAAHSGLLRLYLLYLEDRPVAFVFGVLFKGEYYAFKTSYDVAYHDLSPGTVVFDQVYRDAFAQRLSVVDLGPGTGLRWKSEFSNDVRAHVDVCVFSPSQLRCQACKAYRQELKPRLKQLLPGLVDWKRRLSS